ncbi:MAG: hypothetical protein ACFFD6_05230 [Candidatus Thorarchaeota archaeon]
MEIASNETAKRSRRFAPGAIGALLGVLAIFMPIGMMTYDYGYAQVMAMTWIYFYYPQDIGYPFLNFMFDPFMLFASLPYAFMRPVFAFMTMRAYQGKTTGRRALLSGLIAEVQLPLFFYGIFLVSFMMYPYPAYIPLLLPIPILIIVGLVILRAFPPDARPTKWSEEDQKKSWWDEPEVEKAAVENSKEVVVTRSQEKLPDIKKAEETEEKTEDDWLSDSPW